MPREVRSLFLDIRAAAETLRALAAGKSTDELRDDIVLRLAVERLLITLGEAVARIRRDHPQHAARISAGREIVAMRNLLIHQYEIIELDIVVAVIEEDLNVILDEARAALDDA